MKTSVQKILVAVDGSECSRAALEFAGKLALGLAARVDVITVLDGHSGARADRQGPEAAAARDELRRFVQSVRLDGLALGEELEFGNAMEGIVSKAERDNYDLIVLGTHGRTGRPRSLAGSVAESVVRTASCPVLTVRG
jgi:nucleotide-binding universal stress UspA family protein